MDEESRTVRFLHPGLELDLGGIGKGWALDRAAAILRRYGVEAALLGLGQSSYVAIGAPPGTSGWPITVPHPMAPEEALPVIQAFVALSNVALSPPLDRWPSLGEGPRRFGQSEAALFTQRGPAGVT